jgi:Cys-tRNA(Pro)/Cys-tRNA(Cys) deacylase
MARPKPSGTPAIDALVRAGTPYTLHEYDHDAANRSFGDETVAALGISGDRIFKTLLAEIVGGPKPELVVAVVPVSGSLDLKALAAAVGGRKATMADPTRAERTTGYVVGGISPLGQRTRLRTVVDQSALGQATVLVSAGRRGLQIELSPTDLIALTTATVSPIGRPR